MILLVRCYSNVYLQMEIHTIRKKNVHVISSSLIGLVTYEFTTYSSMRSLLLCAS